MKHTTFYLLLAFASTMVLTLMIWFHWNALSELKSMQMNDSDIYITDKIEYSPTKKSRGTIAYIDRSYSLVPINIYPSLSEALLDSNINIGSTWKLVIYYDPLAIGVLREINQYNAPIVFSLNQQQH